MSQQRYDVLADEYEAEIKRLEVRVIRFENGPRAKSIPAIREEIAKMRSAIPALRGTAKMYRSIYGEFA